MRGNVTDFDKPSAHPEWAVADAKKLLSSLLHCRTLDDQIDIACLVLRGAYHRGGRDTCDELSKPTAAGSPMR